MFSNLSQYLKYNNSGFNFEFVPTEKSIIERKWRVKCEGEWLDIKYKHYACELFPDVVVIKL